MQSRTAGCHAWPELQTKISLHSCPTLNGNYGSVKHVGMKVRWWFKMLWKWSTFIIRVISQSLESRPLIVMLAQDEERSGCVCVQLFSYFSSIHVDLLEAVILSSHHKQALWLSQLSYKSCIGWTSNVSCFIQMRVVQRITVHTVSTAEQPNNQFPSVPTDGSKSLRDIIAPCKPPRVLEWSSNRNAILKKPD